LSVLVGLGIPHRGADKKGSFKLLSGELKIYVKIGESGNKRPQSFCPHCGSPIYSTSTDPDPKVHSVRVGTIRQRDQLAPKLQYWQRSAQRWTPGIGALPSFEKQRP
jgi:hypothetical protein